VANPPKLVVKVRDGAQWVPPGHARTRKAHHVACCLALGRFVTMDGAVGASRLVSPIGTLFQALLSVLHQTGAISAQTAFYLPFVVMVTKDVRHAHQCLVFAFQSAF